MEFTADDMMKMYIGKFKMIKKLGRGAFGTIWLSKYKPTEKLYVLKIVERDKAPYDIDTASHLGITLKHKNLLRVYDFFYEKLSPDKYRQGKSHIIYIMEYIEGCDLFERKNKHEHMNVTKYLYQLIEGLSHLHKNKIIHRDIKPENIIIDKHDNVKIVDYDFLISDYYPNDQVGTPLYAAPEMYTAESYNHKIDLWSLGILVWFIILGSEPFDAETEEELREKIINEEPNWNLIKDINMSMILQGLLEKDPYKRWTLSMVNCYMGLKNL